MSYCRTAENTLHPKEVLIGTFPENWRWAMKGLEAKNRE
jgi:hypothetical protein